MVVVSGKSVAPAPTDTTGSIAGSERWLFKYCPSKSITKRLISGCFKTVETWVAGVDPAGGRRGFVWSVNQCNLYSKSGASPAPEGFAGRKKATRYSFVCAACVNAT